MMEDNKIPIQFQYTEQIFPAQIYWTIFESQYPYPYSNITSFKILIYTDLDEMFYYIPTINFKKSGRNGFKS